MMSDRGQVPAVVPFDSRQDRGSRASSSATGGFDARPTHRPPGPSFEVVLLGAHGGDLSGFCLMRGDRETLARVHATSEFARVTMRAEACLERVGVVWAYVDEGVMRLFGTWQEAIADLV